jgi:hypothetical protein
MASLSSRMQCSKSSEEKQKNQIAQTEFRFITTKIMMSGVITALVPSIQRCTAAKDGKFQDGLLWQTKAVVCCID